jgi:hypothetical protein
MRPEIDPSMHRGPIDHANQVAVTVIACLAILVVLAVIVAFH